MSDIKVGDVVIHDSEMHTREMLFYVGGVNSDCKDNISLVQVTSVPRLAWSLDLPAGELVVVGHVEVEPYQDRYFKPEDMTQFESARQEALKRGTPLNENWTR